MKYFSCFVVVLAFLFISRATAFQNDWFYAGLAKVGKQPVAIESGDYSVTVFCAGLDANFNGIEDAGDEKPSIWHVDLLVKTNDNYKEYVKIESKKIRDLDFGTIGFPFRPAYSTPLCGLDGQCFISHHGRVSSLNCSTWETIEDTVINISASALSSKNNRLYLSVRVDINGDYTPDTNFVVVYDLSSKKILDTIPAYTNVQQTIAYNDSSLVILSEGVFGSNNSKLQFVSIDSNSYKITKTLDIGDGGNHLFQFDDILFVTMNGSHEVKVIDLNTKEITKSIKIPTTGYNGPRESYYSTSSNRLYTPAYNSWIYISDIEKGIVVDSISAYDKAEEVSSIGALFMMAATPFLKDSYSVDSTIKIYAGFALSVTESNKENYFNITPNPITDYGRIEIINTNGINSAASIEIYSAIGIKVAEYKLNDNNKNIIDIDKDQLGLSNGMYYVVLKNRGNSYMQSFVVSE